MKDPYEVLGVSRTASDNEIKKAYHDLVKKYHPDNYTDNPLADLASEKMKEINEAYDSITKGRAASGNSQNTGSSYGSYQGAGYTGENQSQYNTIRSYINANQLDYAENLLNGIANRNAEWYFLKGMVALRRGWMDDARRSFQSACSLAPGNSEYQRALQTVQGGYTPYRSNNYQGSDFETACNICNTLLCLNCLCGGCGR